MLIIQRPTTFASFTRMILSYIYFLDYSFKDLLPGEMSLACHNSREIKETWPGREMIKFILRNKMDDNTDQD